MESILGTFVRCLEALPNLHTLEVISMGTHYSQPLRHALGGVELPQIRTLILPSMAHSLLRHCPNVDDLTCTPFRPDKEFVESLAKGQQKLRRFAVLFPGNVITWNGEGYSQRSECMINGPSFRAGSNLPRRQRTIRSICKLISEHRWIDADRGIYQWDNVPGDTRDCITALPNLSTLQIIYLVPYHDVLPLCNLGLEAFLEQVECQSTYRERMGKKSEDRWNELKEMAIEHLKSCSGSGPKVLRTVVLDHDRMSGMHFNSVPRVEEIEVWK